MDSIYWLVFAGVSYVFEIIILQVSGRVYNMSAKSELEQEEWMAAVRESLETVRKIYVSRKSNEIKK